MKRSGEKKAVEIKSKHTVDCLYDHQQQLYHVFRHPEEEI